MAQQIAYPLGLEPHFSRYYNAYMQIQRKYTLKLPQRENVIGKTRIEEAGLSSLAFILPWSKTTPYVSISFRLWRKPNIQYFYNKEYSYIQPKILSN